MSSLNESLTFGIINLSFFLLSCFRIVGYLLITVEEISSSGSSPTQIWTVNLKFFFCEINSRLLKNLPFGFVRLHCFFWSTLEAHKHLLRDWRKLWECFLLDRSTRYQILIQNHYSCSCKTYFRILNIFRKNKTLNYTEALALFFSKNNEGVFPLSFDVKCWRKNDLRIWNFLVVNDSLRLPASRSSAKSSSIFPFVDFSAHLFIT